MLPIGQVLEEGGLGAHRLLLAHRLDPAGVDTVGELMQVASGGPAEDPLQVTYVSARQGAHVLDPPSGQDLLRPGADAPQGPDRQHVEEVLRGGGRHQE